MAAEEEPADTGNSIVQNRSLLRDFIASIATIRGDLSNITAPPFVLSTTSTVELPAFWAERPAVFVAAAAPKDPSVRALQVLRWFISALRGQQYAGRRPEDGVKKPLNAFLGELFLARWEDDVGTTRLVCEQVSHHPPVTACRVWNEEHGVYAEGFTRQEITFSGSVNIQQIGYATLYLEKHDETYLIPLPNVKVKGILSGTPYPELNSTYYIPSTNGYTSSITFSGKGFFGSDDKKHSFDAKLYPEDQEDSPLFTVSGHWDSEFVIHDVQAQKDIETYDVRHTSPTSAPTPLKTEPLQQQDPWETQRAWKDVREALRRGDMQGTSDAKNLVEKGQRQMRKDEVAAGREWQRVFYKPVQTDEVATQLAAKIGRTIAPEDTVALWKFDTDKWGKDKLRPPYHGDLRPDNSQAAVAAAEKEGPVSDHTSTKAGDDAIAAVNRRDSVHPPLPVEVQQREVEETRKLESGIEGMTVQEKIAVEEMLRDRYSNSAKR